MEDIVCWYGRGRRTNFSCNRKNEAESES